MLTECDRDRKLYVQKEEKKRGKTTENIFGQFFQIVREITVYLGTFTSRVSSTLGGVLISNAGRDGERGFEPWNAYFKLLYRFEGGRFLYKLHRSPMCEYMINFILKLKHLPEKYMMNSVLENFTILQVGLIYPPIKI
jgi:hypothetical protein